MLSELLADFLAEMPLLGWIRDTKSRYVFMNRQYEPDPEISGNASVIGKSVYDLYTNKTARKYEQNDQRIIQSKQQVNFIEKRDDKYFHVYMFPLLKDNEVIAIGGIESDVTQQKEKEEELRTEKEFFQALLDNIPHTIYFKDREFRFTRINAAQTRLMGLDSPAQAIGKTDFDFFHDKHAQEAYADEQHIFETGQPLIDKLEKMKSKSRKLNWISTTKVPIYNNAGKIEGLVGLSVDVTDKRNAEINLERALLKAEEADRLKSAFLANMSHDIRTPMNGILGFADLLKNPNISKEQQEKYVNHIIRSGSTLLGLIDDIIDISKIEAGQLKINKKAVNINEVMEDIYMLFENDRKANNRKFAFDVQKGLPDDASVIVTDPVRIKQILGNLISNAFKFTHEGEVKVGYSKVNGMLEFFVHDTGMGIADEYQEIIFDRFGQVEETETMNKKGTGLGLAITANLVDYLGGKIRLDSKLGKGSIFYFTIPYQLPDNEQVDENQELQDPKPVSSLKGMTIMIAEDEDMNYLYLAGALKATEATLIRAKNGKEAISIVAQRSDIDLVLMDIKLPFVNGYDATRAIKQIHPEMPVIAQTAFVSENDKNKCFEAGCDYYLSKPIKKETLIKVVGEYMRERK